MKFIAILNPTQAKKFAADFFELDIARLVEFNSNPTYHDFKNMTITLTPLKVAEDSLISSFEDGQLSGWNDSFSARSKCPFDGTAYKDIPGYETGFGCHVCKGIGVGHLTLHGLKDIKEAIAKAKELKEKAGVK